MTVRFRLRDAAETVLPSCDLMIPPGEPMAMDDVLIVGGGVIGLSLAYELASRGMQVRVLDRSAAGREASWAGAGILPPAGPHDPQPLEQLACLSNRLHRTWAAQLREETGIDNGLRPCGALYLARSAEDAAALRQAISAWESVGVNVQALTAAEVAELEPALRTSNPPIEAAALLPDEAQIRNPWHLRALVAGCLNRGVTIEQGVAAEQLVVRGSQLARVQTVAGPRQAGRYVIASGSWTATLAAQLNVRLALRPIRGQIALLSMPRRPLERIVNEGPRYLVPRADGRVIVGSTQEDVGFDKRNTAEGINGLLSLATSLASCLADATLETTWAGLRPGTADGLPYLGQVPGLENAYVAAGHFRGGLTLSTGTARVLAQALCDEPTEVPLDAFRLDRHAAATSTAM